MLAASPDSDDWHALRRMESKPVRYRDFNERLPWIFINFIGHVLPWLGNGGCAEKISERVSAGEYV